MEVFGNKICLQKAHTIIMKGNIKEFGFREYGRLPKGVKKDEEYITIIKMYLDLEKFNL